MLAPTSVALPLSTAENRPDTTSEIVPESEPTLIVPVLAISEIDPLSELDRATVTEAASEAVATSAMVTI